MPRNPRVDAYIEKAPEFARPILTHLREVVHAACPEVDEQIKWGMPSFEHKGPMCGMAAFKGHCALSFWKHQLLFESRSAGAPGTGAAAKKTGKKTAKKTATKAGTRASAADAKPVADESAMGEFGRITSLKDLPSKRELTALIKRAVRLNDEGVKAPRTLKPKETLVTPKDLAGALSKNKSAKERFAAFSYSHKREYIEWITEAKTPETRARRLATAVEWIAEGKGRNWKYQKK